VAGFRGEGNEPLGYVKSDNFLTWIATISFSRITTTVVVSGKEEDPTYLPQNQLQINIFIYTRAN
jgi:hypothetical protein